MVKFIVYGIPRVGSNYFISKLNQHPEIICHYEIFHKNEIYYGFEDKNIKVNTTWDLKERDQAPYKFLNFIWENNYKNKAVGYNIFPNQNDKIVEESAKDTNIKKIILKRKDILKNFISLKIAMKTQVWSSKDTQNKPVVKDKRIIFDKNEFKKYVFNMNKFYSNLENNIALNGDDYLVIYYEDFIANKQETLQKVFNYLDIQEVDLFTKEEKFTKQNSDSLEDLILNYQDLTDFLEKEYINFFQNSANITLDSHNKLTNAIEHICEVNILKEPIKKFKMYKAMINTYHEIKNNLYSYSNKPVKNETYKNNTIKLNNSKHGKINLLNQLDLYDTNIHRAGWNYAMASLVDLHNENGVLLNANIDSTFSKWKKNITIPTLTDWIGFIHFPHNIPSWHPQSNINEKIFNSDDFKKSLPYCKGIYTLSNYHKEYLENKIDIPIETLYHPTLTPELKFNWDRFEANQNKQIVQLGFFLRRLHSIYELHTDSFQKVFLKPNTSHVENLMKLEFENDVKNKNIDYSQTKVVNFLENEKYDELLSNNIAFLHLYDASANNAIIECIVRNTPVLVNPLESVVEYLGKDYPLYFNTLEEASEKLHNNDLLYEAYKYLLNYPFKLKLSKEYFLESFKNSEIYKGL